MLFAACSVPPFSVPASLKCRQLGPALLESLRFVAESGIRGVQLNLHEFGNMLVKCDRRTWVDIAVGAVATGVRLRSMHLVPVDKLENCPDCLRCQNLIMEIAQIMGIKKLVVHLGGPLHWGPRSLKLDIKCVSTLARAAAKTDTVILIENTPSCSTAYVLEVVKNLNEGNVLIQFDVGHWMLKREESVKSLLASIADKLGGIELHDNDGVSDLHLLPGSGAVPWQEVFSAVRQINFTEAPVLEPLLAMRGIRPTARTRKQLADTLETVASAWSADNLPVS